MPEDDAAEKSQKAAEESVLRGAIESAGGFPGDHEANRGENARNGEQRQFARKQRDNESKQRVDIKFDANAPARIVPGRLIVDPEAMNQQEIGDQRAGRVRMERDAGD